MPPAGAAGRRAVTAMVRSVSTTAWGRVPSTRSLRRVLSGGSAPYGNSRMFPVPVTVSIGA